MAWRCSGAWGVLRPGETAILGHPGGDRGQHMGDNRTVDQQQQRADQDSSEALALWQRWRSQDVGNLSMADARRVVERRAQQRPATTKGRADGK